MNSTFSYNDCLSRKTKPCSFSIKHLTSFFSLIILTKILIWNKITFKGSKSLNLAKLVVNELLRSMLKFASSTFSVQFCASCKDFKSF